MYYTLYYKVKSSKELKNVWITLAHPHERKTHEFVVIFILTTTIDSQMMLITSLTTGPTHDVGDLDRL